jgi:hypothetical protein
MDYKEFENTIVDYLSENLSSEKRAEFELFLENNTEFQKEFETTKLFWNADAEEMPEPTSKMDMDFYSMLKAEEEKANKVSVLTKIQNFFTIKPVKQFAYTLAILTIGFFVGNGFNSNSNLSDEKIEFAQKETQDVRSQLV